MTSDPDDLIQVVIDDRTADILRVAAEARGIDVELLMVQLLIAAARHIDELLAEDPATQGLTNTEARPTRPRRSRWTDQ